jgi:hypothetical protein
MWWRAAVQLKHSELAALVGARGEGGEGIEGGGEWNWVACACACHGGGGGVAGGGGTG